MHAIHLSYRSTLQPKKLTENWGKTEIEGEHYVLDDLYQSTRSVQQLMYVSFVYEQETKN